MATIVGIDALRKSYGDRTVLDIGRLELERGGRYALVGANGCGKTTLLRILAGTLQPDGPRPLVQAEDIGYMPQKAYLFDLTVSRNVALGAGKDDAERVRRALESVGMLDLARERGSGLSGGEAQRVSFARLIAGQHDLLLLDEPTASMDISGTAHVEKALDAYCSETGCTLLVSTHAPSQALRLAGETIMLHAGRIVEQGPTDRVLRTPESPEGEEFLSYWRI